MRPRRDPQQAKSLILDGADRVFASAFPEKVGLKEVAREADVSPALVSHYFGTYEALVEATLERRVAIARDRLLREVAALDPTRNLEALLDRALHAVEDPVLLRLAAWALLSSRLGSAPSFPARVQGLKQVVDALLALAAARGLTISREDVELALATGVSLLLGYELAKVAIWTSLARPSDERSDRMFHQHVLRLLLAQLAAKPA